MSWAVGISELDGSRFNVLVVRISFVGAGVDLFGDPFAALDDEILLVDAPAAGSPILPARNAPAIEIPTELVALVLPLLKLPLSSSSSSIEPTLMSLPFFVFRTAAETGMAELLRDGGRDAVVVIIVGGRGGAREGREGVLLSSVDGLMVDEEGFRGVVDAVGGRDGPPLAPIDVDSPESFLTAVPDVEAAAVDAGTAGIERLARSVRGLPIAIGLLLNEDAGRGRGVAEGEADTPNSETGMVEAVVACLRLSGVVEAEAMGRLAGAAVVVVVVDGPEGGGGLGRDDDVGNPETERPRAAVRNQAG
jgi:hypothetical protein